MLITEKIRSYILRKMLRLDHVQQKQITQKILILLCL